MNTTYWAQGRPLDQIARIVRNAFCASAWHDTVLVGFARLITDFATHAYLADVMVDPAWRRRGIATRLVRSLIDHEAVATCSISLNTRDASAVYQPLGFIPPRETPMMRPRRCNWPLPSTEPT